MLNLKLRDTSDQEVSAFLFIPHCSYTPNMYTQIVGAQTGLQ